MITTKATGYHAIRDEMIDLRKLFDLDIKHTAQRFFKVAAQGIMENMDQERDPDDVPWPALDPDYASWKVTIAPGAPMGVLYGIMKTLPNMIGHEAITQFTAQMGFTDDPVPMIEAYKFTYGGLVTGTNQPPRVFYGLTNMAIIRAYDILDDIFYNDW